MPSDECKLCGNQAELQESHVLPAFVFKWQRASSGSGHLRSSENPNQRVQDGAKEYWLCSACEGLFSRSEKAFADRLFHPYIGRSGGRFPYGPWLLHFCVSISWRVLKFGQEKSQFGDWSKEQISGLQHAEAGWRRYLLGEHPHPGRFRQHLLPMDQLASGAEGMEPNINRFMMRAIAMDICRGTGSLFTHAKLGRFVIIGEIIEDHPQDWQGTKVNANQGFVEPSAKAIPYMLKDYWNDKARSMADSLGSVSARQQRKIDDAFRANVDRYAGSDAFNAMNADVGAFGGDAFRRKGSG